MALPLESPLPMPMPLSLEALITALRDPAAYDHPVQAVELMETHISWILLTGAFAYKIRKPVQLGFVDFSTAPRRRWFSYEEVRLNRRLAPELYLGVVPIHGPSERARLHGTGPVIEVAVRMRQFDQQDMLPVQLQRGALTPALLEQLARTLLAFHAAATVAPAGSPFGSAALVPQPALANLDSLERSGLALPGLDRLRQWTASQAAALAPCFERRRRLGAVRECHGDLHLGNMVLREGRITVFDCLEFSESLRWIDVISDMAFLVMDLRQRGRPDLAAVLLNRWLQEGGDYRGMRLWRWYLVYRALVRAKVAALRLSQLGAGSVAHTAVATGTAELRSYLDLAQGFCQPARVRLVICHGVSGSGKSHLSGRLARRLGWIQLRSDLERRRLFGRCAALLPQRSWRGDAYRPEVGEHLYGVVLREAAAAVLAAGESLIVDATFLRRAERRLFRQLAHEHRADFTILDCQVGLALAQRRIEGRLRDGRDVSEADTAVLQRQWRSREPLDQAERRDAVVIDTASTCAGPEWEALLVRLGGGGLEHVAGEGPQAAGEGDLSGLNG